MLIGGFRDDSVSPWCGDISCRVGPSGLGLERRTRLAPGRIEPSKRAEKITSASCYSTPPVVRDWQHRRPAAGFSDASATLAVGKRWSIATREGDRPLQMYPQERKVSFSILAPLETDFKSP